MTRQATAAVSTGLAVLIGCVTTIPPPAPRGADSSLLGIKVEIRDPLLKFIEWDAEAVYFVNADGDPLSQQFLIPSNYVSDGYAYLVNVPPGRYAAVAAYYTQETGPSTTTTDHGRGWSSSVTVSGTFGFMTYFPSSVIQKTAVALEPSSVAFMGEWVVDRAFTMNDADQAQLHYYDLVAPEDAETSFLLRGPHFKGTEHASDRSERAHQQFFDVVRTRFVAGWSNVLQAPVGSAPPTD